MLALLRPSFVLVGLCTLVFGVLYPALVTGVGQVAFPRQANGSLLVAGDTIRGSRLIGQAFADAGHLWSRPSATGPTPYNGAASSGSNLGPSNPALHDAVRERVARAAGDGHRRVGARGPGHVVGQRARPAHLAGRGRAAGAAHRRGSRHRCRGRAPGRRAPHRGSAAGRVRRTAGERARRQPRTREWRERAGPLIVPTCRPTTAPTRMPCSR